MDTIIGVIGTLLGVFGILVTLKGLEWKRRKTWPQIVAEIDKLDGYLRSRNVRVDYIVSFADGGLIAADLLHIRHRLDAPVVCVSLDIKRPGLDPHVGSKDVSVTEQADNLRFLVRKSVLIIDDVVQTGRTLERVVKFLTDSVGVKRDHIFTAVLGRPKGAKGFDVEYVGFEYSVKIDLPWGPVPRHSG